MRSERRFSSHEFVLDTTEPFGGDEWNPPGIASRYFCHGCCCFIHYYHFRPDIVEAMAVAGVPETCNQSRETPGGSTTPEDAEP